MPGISPNPSRLDFDYTNGISKVLGNHFSFECPYCAHSSMDITIYKRRHIKPGMNQPSSSHESRSGRNEKNGRKAKAKN